MKYRHAAGPIWGRNGFTIDPAIDRFFARAFDVPVWSGGSDVRELDDRAEVTLDVPGVTPEQIQIAVENRTVSVKVEREGREPFTRQYTIGTKYDLNQIQARLNLGVLTLTLQRAAESQPKTVPITVA